MVPPAGRGRGGEAVGQVEMEGGPWSRRGPALAQGAFDGLNNVGWQYRFGPSPDPVVQVWLVGSDQERCPRGVRILDRKRARRPGQTLEVCGRASQPPTVGRAVANDAPCALTPQCHDCPSVRTMLATPALPSLGSRRATPVPDRAGSHGEHRVSTRGAAKTSAVLLSRSARQRSVDHLSFPS